MGREDAGAADGLNWVEAAPKAQHDGPFRERLKGHGMTPNPAPELLWKFEKFLVGRDGKIRERNTYGHDPRGTKG